MLQIDSKAVVTASSTVISIDFQSTDLDGLLANGVISRRSGVVAAPVTGTNGSDTLSGDATSTLVQGLGGNDSLDRR